MKRITIFLFFIFLSISSLFMDVSAETEKWVSADGTIYNTTEEKAELDWGNNAATSSETWKGDAASSWWPTTVMVTEKIPGMDCSEEKGGGPKSKKYKCTIQPGFGSVMLILKGLIKYTTFIVALIGVLMLVVSGIQYSISGADKWAADAAKKRIEKVLAGIVLLFLIGFILNSVAPWVYR